MMLFDVAAITPLQRVEDIIVDITGIEWDFLEAAFFTILIEVPLFCLCGYRKKRELLYFAGVNFISNILLNEFLNEASSDWNENLLIAVGEIAVLLLEFCLCCYFIKDNRKKLFKTLVLTNAASFLIGCAYFLLF